MLPGSEASSLSRVPLLPNALWFLTCMCIGGSGLYLHAPRRTGWPRNFDVIYHVNGSRRLCHPCRRALVLHHRGGPGPGGHTVLDMHLKPLLADLGLRQLRLDGRLHLGIAELALAVGHAERTGLERDAPTQEPSPNNKLSHAD